MKIMITFLHMEKVYYIFIKYNKILGISINKKGNLNHIKI